MSAEFTPTHYKLTVEDYHKLGEAGILDEDSRVKLIEVEPIQSAPIGGPHLRTFNRLNKLLGLAVRDLAEVSVQNPVTLPPWSEPQPDFCILRHSASGEATTVPQPDEVLLLVEVSDSTLAYDRGRKLRLNAKAGIAEVWIVDVTAQRVECHWQPEETHYAHKVIRTAAERIHPTALPEVEIDLSAVFAGDHGRSTTTSSLASSGIPLQ